MCRHCRRPDRYSTITVPSAPILIVMKLDVGDSQVRAVLDAGRRRPEVAPFAPAARRGLDHALKHEHVLDRAGMQVGGDARAALQARPVNVPLGRDVGERKHFRPGPTLDRFPPRLLRQSECLPLLVERQATLPSTSPVSQRWQTPVRQDQSAGTSQAAASSSRLP
jgi:hypothetical protein